MFCTRLMAYLGPAILVGGLAAPVIAQTTLRYKFNNGDKLDYLVDQKLTGKIVNGPLELKMDGNQTIDLSWNIISVGRDGSAKIKQKIERFRFMIDSSDVKFKYDSKDDKPPEGAYGELMGPLCRSYAALEMTMTIDARGRIKDVVLPPEFEKQIKAASSGQTFLQDTVLLPNQLTLAFPNDAIGKGQGWSQTTESKTAEGRTVLNYAYTLEGEVSPDGRKMQSFSVKPTITLEPARDRPQVNVKNREANGMAYFDNDTGRFLESSIVQDLELNESDGTKSFSRLVRTMKLKVRK